MAPDAWHKNGTSNGSLHALHVFSAPYGQSKWSNSLLLGGLFHIPSWSVRVWAWRKPTLHLFTRKTVASTSFNTSKPGFASGAGTALNKTFSHPTGEFTPFWDNKASPPQHK